MYFLIKNELLQSKLVHLLHIFSFVELFSGNLLFIILKIVEILCQLALLLGDLSECVIFFAV